MAESPDITTRLGLFLCDTLSAAITGVAFRPDQGTADTEIPIPGNNGVPIIKSAVQFPPAEAYMVEVHLNLQTSTDDSTPEVHSDLVRQACSVIQEIKKAGAHYYDARQIFINGLYIKAVRPIPSENDINTVVEIQIACQIMAAAA